MSNLWFTSDNHFNHRNLLEKYAPNRTATWKSVEEMNEGLRDNWNAVVRPNDTVYMLGDVFFWKDIETAIKYLRSLNGKKELILGNHDQLIEKNLALFDKTTAGKWQTAEPPPFESIQHYKEIKIHNHTAVLFHFGQRVWNKSHHGSWHLYGHSHGGLPPYGKSVDVGIDSAWVTGKYEHRPFSSYEIKNFMDKQDLKQADQHGENL